MSTLTLIAGALTLKGSTFNMLRERSDVFYRGFLVLLLVGLFAGLFASGADLATRVLRPANERLITQEALRGFENSYTGPAEGRPVIESYITEGVGMGFEITRLPPQAGAAFRPFARLLNWLGQAASVPFGVGYLGMLLLGGLLVHLAARWLGGRAGISQMLGLSALAFAPHLLDPISSLLVLAGALTGTGALTTIENLIGFVVLVWGVAIYVKATAVAQGFSYGRAVGAVLIALGLGLLLVVLVAVIVGGLAAAAITALVVITR